MAEAGGDIGKKFKEFATKADGKEATSKDMTKWCKDAGIFGKTCSSNNMDIAFSKCKVKGKPNMTMKELMPFIDELAKTYKADKKLADNDTAKQQIVEKMSKCDKVHVGTAKVAKVGGVDRLTDTSKYTGAHKERFDESGKGKGKSGRVEQVDDSGYVGQYKGKDTYDEKK